MIERSGLNWPLLNQVCVKSACAEPAFDIGLSYFFALSLFLFLWLLALRLMLLAILIDRN